MNAQHRLLFRRREFFRVLGGSVAGLACLGGRALAAPGSDLLMPKVSIFSKVYQELKLNYADAAALTAEAGLDGIDCPVRPNGEIPPERADEELPKYADALAKHGLKVIYVTTAIRGLKTPHVETVLRATAKLGVKYYRLDHWNYEAGKPKEQMLAEIKAQLKDLAALNKELGVCGLLQNHAGKTLVGAKVHDYAEIVKDLDPKQIAIAFDLGHAVNELDDGWRAAFEELRSHFAVAYVKDWKRDGGFVPFGQGIYKDSEWFTLLKEMNYSQPFSMHTEYKWAPKGKGTREMLAAALKSDLNMMKKWWKDA